MRQFTKAQRRVCAGCLVVYAGAYVARLNLAAALPGIVLDLGLAEAQGGVIQMVFSIVYAAGQLINGAMVDRVSARRYILIGLVASALCNLLFGLAQAYWQLVLLWALNGAAQSMLWTPVVKLMAGWFDVKQRRTVSMWVSFSLIGGHFLSWAIAGYMAQLFSWRLSFLAPAALLLGFAGLALVLIQDPRDGEFVTAARADRNVEAMPVKRMLLGTGLWLLLICCMASGFVRDGVMTWGPSILSSLQSEDAAVSSVTLSLIIPAINLLGVLLGQVSLRRARSNVRRIIGVMMGCGCGMSLLLVVFSGGSLLSYALLLGGVCALMYGVNPLETVVLPMDYAPYGRVGLAAGIIDSSLYLGAAIASVTTGILKDALGLEAVFVSWAIAAATGMVAVLLSLPAAQRTLQAAGRTD